MNDFFPDDELPLISIIIPVYNRKDLVQEAVQSALKQSYRAVEVVVVDDASDDGSYDVLKRFLPVIVLLRHEHNRGQSAARNTGIKACKGRYVLFLDSDDTLEPDAIEVLWSAFKRLEPDKEQWGLCYGKRLTCDKELNPVKTTPKKYHSGSVLPYLIKDNIVRTGTYLVKKSVLDEVGGFYEGMVVKEDLLLLFNIAKRYRFYFVDHYISRFRRHPGHRARDSYNKILEQGVLHLDCFFENDFESGMHLTAKLKKRAYAREHLQMTKIAWRLSQYKQYLFHWKKMCLYRKTCLIYPEYAFRAFFSVLKSFKLTGYIAKR